MIEKITDDIRQEYYNLEVNKNEKLDLTIKLREIEEIIKNQETKVKELEEDRSFYTLVNMYNSYKDYDFPNEIRALIIKREIYLHIFTPCCGGVHISNLTFGQWLDLWSSSWNYEGNPIIFSQYHNGGGYIKYWDLNTQKIKIIRKVLQLDIDKYLKDKKEETIDKANDIIKYIKNNM